MIPKTIHIVLLALLIVFALSCKKESEGTVEPMGNKAPKIIRIEADLVSIKLGGVSKLKAIAEDPDGDVIFYEWKSTENGLIAEANQEIARFIGMKSGEAVVTCIIKDGMGASSTETVKILISSGGVVPTITTIIPSVEKPGVGQPVSFSASYNNPGNEQITLSWNITGNGILLSGGGTSATYVPKSIGPHVVSATIRAVASGNSSSKTFQIEAVDTPNKAPVIKSIVSSSDTLKINQPHKITCIAEDPNGDELSYGWDLTLGFNSGVTMLPDVEKNSIIFTSRILGQHRIRVRVSDTSGFLDIKEKNLFLIQ